jgi:signal transduction histidine kinase
MNETSILHRLNRQLRRVTRAIPKMLLLPIVFAAVLTLVAIGFSEYHFSSTQYGIDQLRIERERYEAVDRIYTLLVNAENGQRGYLLTGNAEYLQALELANMELSRMQNRLAVGFAGRPAELDNADGLRQLATRKLIELQTTVQLYKMGDQLKALQLFNSGQGAQIMEDLRVKVGEFSGQLKNEFGDNRARWQQQWVTARVGMLSLALLNLLLLAFVVVLLTRESEQREYIQRLVESENVRLFRQVEARTQDLNALTSHLQLVTEKDKAALARDLHDELGGILTSAKMDLDWLGAQDRHNSSVAQRFAQLSALLDDAVQVKRRVVENLRPSLIDNLGLAAALEWYLDENCRKAGIEYTLTVAEELGAISPDAAIALYRMVQEALTNVIRHSAAAHFAVTMEVRDGQLQLSMADDGKGLPEDFSPSLLAHGMSGMRQRARALGGSIEWKSAPGEGTAIVAIIPLPRAA